MTKTVPINMDIIIIITILFQILNLRSNANLQKDILIWLKSQLKIFDLLITIYAFITKFQNKKHHWQIKIFYLNQ